MDHFHPVTKNFSNTEVQKESAGDVQTSLKAASRTNSRQAYEMFVEAADRSARHCTLRGQLDLQYEKEPIALDLVEPATNILKRFSTVQEKYPWVLLKPYRDFPR
ncbi:unnamed protein product [Dicrocoelium dendriticum]|nr:unnamed protein product [Dicrocoelium dendriticum]